MSYVSYIKLKGKLDSMQGGQLCKHGNRNIMIIKLEVSNIFNSKVKFKANIAYSTLFILSFPTFLNF